MILRIRGVSIFVFCGIVVVGVEVRVMMWLVDVYFCGGDDEGRWRMVMFFRQDCNWYKMVYRVGWKYCC